MKVLIGTTNPGKIEGAERAFNKFFENVVVEGYKSASNVPDQPVNLDIYKGAKNRVLNLIEFAKQNQIEADYFVAVESGITDSLGKWEIINVAVIIDKNGYESWGNSAGFPVPQKLVDKIISTDLGTVMDELFEKHELHNSVGGVNFLTHGKISRIDLNDQAFSMALTQFINNNIWKD
ncbi:MAG: DUF84 family protein [Clostridia bacterium]|nr:DUF84 family protein [Clostridia bacterium]